MTLTAGLAVQWNQPTEPAAPGASATWTTAPDRPAHQVLFKDVLGKPLPEAERLLGISTGKITLTLSGPPVVVAVPDDNPIDTLPPEQLTVTTLCTSREKAPPQTLPATLDGIADHIADIITNGTRTQAKALIETLVAHVAITGPDRLVPTFRIPQPGNDIGAGTASAIPAPMESVRAMTRLVDLMRAYSNQGTLTSTLKRIREQASDRRKLEAVQNLPQPRALSRRVTAAQRAAIVIAYEAGSSANRLASEYGLGKGSILKILRTSGAAIRQQRRLTDQEIDHALACYRDGQSLARIASRLNVAHTTVMTALERRGVPRRDGHGRPR
ncbi:hypothetical protein GL305_12260 [Nocardia seriolae]|uniref:helix-turn-helix domain-containing protein n=1 Tax=Nocardia seriolae TaxID=37332 RepID=UPI0012BB937B|nr:helix-turn-helix domain-containing protein [Nocardia seriolae]MTJ86750.1 hypothetical protein [Nocardia seriolae]MTK30745.1 hypothetical protein [Nocardia seriolae]MTK39716.1 hypothetical protein [Nocardia seriolae]